MCFIPLLPTQNYAKVNLRDWWGHKFLWGCNKIGDDHYYADALFSAEAIIRVVISLEPQIRVLENGDYEIKIKPLTDVVFGLNEIDLDFDFHGRSDINSATTAINGGFSSFIQGRWEQFGYEASLFSLELIGNLNGIEDLNLGSIIEFIANKKLSEIEGHQLSISNQFQENISSKLSHLLGLDINGERVYIVNIDVPRVKISSVLIPVNMLLLQ